MVEEMATVASMSKALYEIAERFGCDARPEVVAEMEYVVYQVWELLGEIESELAANRSGATRLTRTGRWFDEGATSCCVRPPTEASLVPKV